MRRPEVTIRHVAERAGVSASTVSHVLNGNDQHVGATKRARVLEVVRELNYRPNAIARSMVKRATATIGLVITELQNPLFVPVTEGVEDVLRAEGYQIILASATDWESEAQAIETLRTQQVDGFIFMSISQRYPSDHILKLKEEGFPVVVINRYLEDDTINRVQIDDRNAGYTATRHLLSLKHTRLGAITGALDQNFPRRSALERHVGWQQAIQEAGLPSNPAWVADGQYTFEGGYQSMRRILAEIWPKPAAERPTAFFIANESMAVGALKALYEAGVRVPQELAIVTVGDPPFAAYTAPALTTIALPVVEAGQTAARILVENLKATTALPAQHITLTCHMNIRESCGAKNL